MGEPGKWREGGGGGVGDGGGRGERGGEGGGRRRVCYTDRHRHSDAPVAEETPGQRDTRAKRGRENMLALPPPTGKASAVEVVAVTTSNRGPWA